MRECSPPQTCHMSCVTCHVMCHVSHVTCHVSHVINFPFFLTKWLFTGVESFTNGARASTLYRNLVYSHIRLIFSYDVSPILILSSHKLYIPPKSDALLSRVIDTLVQSVDLIPRVMPSSTLLFLLVPFCSTSQTPIIIGHRSIQALASTSE